MKYTCEVCNYGTDYVSNYHKHNRTLNHRKKVEEHTDKNLSVISPVPSGALNTLDKRPPKKHNRNENRTKYVCQFCGNEIIRKSSYTRHMQTCPERNDQLVIYQKEIENLKKEIEFLKREKDINDRFIEEVEDHKDTLKKENDFHKGIIQETGTMAKTAYNYVMKNYAHAPNLLEFKQFDLLEPELKEDENELADHALPENIIYLHSKKRLDAFIGQIIVSEYKKTDASKQSLWNTDSARLGYLVKEIVNKKSIWSIDKSAVKVIDKIITPILNFIDEEMREYANVLHNKIKKKFKEQLWQDMDTLRSVQMNCHNGELAKLILKHITPHFHISKGQNLLELKE